MGDPFIEVTESNYASQEAKGIRMEATAQGSALWNLW